MSDHLEQDRNKYQEPDMPATPALTGQPDEKTTLAELSEPPVGEVPEPPAGETVEEAESGRQSSLRSAFEWLEAAVFALVLVTLIFSCVCRTVGVNGDSMMDTLMDKDRLLLRTNFYTPRRGDVVVVRIPGQREPLIKRVIGVGGDTVRLDLAHNAVYLNGQRLEEPYVHYPLAYNVQWKDDRYVDPDGTIHIPEGKIFVMGDHRNLSRDSRDPSVWLIDVENVMGQAFFRIFPLDKIGTF